MCKFPAFASSNALKILEIPAFGGLSAYCIFKTQVSIASHNPQIQTQSCKGQPPSKYSINIAITISSTKGFGINMARFYVGSGCALLVCCQSFSISVSLPLSLSEEKHLDLSMVFWGESRINPIKTLWSPELILRKKDYMTCKKVLGIYFLSCNALHELKKCFRILFGNIFARMVIHLFPGDTMPRSGAIE